MNVTAAMLSHKVRATVESASEQFQQSRSDYVATCSCGWTHKTRMGYGWLGAHRTAVLNHVESAR